MSLPRFMLLCCLLLGTALAGQDTLLVTDETSEPLPFVMVVLWPDNRAIGETDTMGRFVLNPLEIGQSTISLNYLGYGENRTNYERLRAAGFRYRMRPGNSVLPTMVVVGRRDEAFTEVNQQVEVIGNKEIARIQSLTTADALADLSGVYVQKSQFGGGSPVVRGFEANRVLLVVDGVRMNNAIFRSGHLQNAITVDPLALDRLEVLYGAGALAYGSDAIGGVVHFRTEEPQFVHKGAGPQDAVKGQLAMRYSSAANAFTTGGKLGYGATNWAGLTLLSLSATSHLRAGAQRPDRFPGFGRREGYVERRPDGDVIVPNPDPNVQVGTAYNQYNLLQKFRFRLRDRLELSANFQFSTTSDVPRYDALIERRAGALRWARWDYGAQTRALGALRLQDRRPTKLYDLASYLISYQFVEEDRITRLFNNPNTDFNLVDVHALNLQTDFTKYLSERLTLRYGADLRRDVVASTAYREIFQIPGQLVDVPTRYPSQGSSLFSAGAYAESRYELDDRWAARGGIRLSRQRLSATFGANDPVAWPQAYLGGIDNTESALTATLGLQQANGWRFLYAEGFRAPNIDDFAKFRERNGFIQVPNPALQPERSQTVEIGYRLAVGKASFGHRLTAELTGYHTWLKDAIVRRVGTLPDGSSTLVLNNETLRVQTNANAESARVYGADLVLRYEFTHELSLRTEAHYLHGRRNQLVAENSDRTIILPQDHIPPPYGSTALNWKSNDCTLGFRLRYQLAKQPEDYAVGAVFAGGDGLIFDRTGTADNFELTPADENGNFTGTYGWWTAHLAAEYNPSDRWTLRLRADNLLDKHYRTFASGVSAPGIDVGVGFDWRF